MTTTRGAKRAATSDHAAPEVPLPSKRVMDGPSFDVHRAESSHQHMMAGPTTLDRQRAEAASKHVRALNAQFASWVQSQLQNHPAELWEDGMKDYISHASEIMDEFKDVVNWLRQNKTGSAALSSPSPPNDEKTTSSATVDSMFMVQPSSDNGQKVPVTVASSPAFQNSSSPNLFSFSSHQKTPAFTGIFGDEKNMPGDSNKPTFQFGANNGFSTPSMPSIFSASGAQSFSMPTQTLFSDEFKDVVNWLRQNKTGSAALSSPSPPNDEKTTSSATVDSMFMVQPSSDNGQKVPVTVASSPAFQNSSSPNLFSFSSHQKTPAFTGIFGDEKNMPGDSNKPTFQFGANNGFSTPSMPSIFSASGAQSFSMPTQTLFSVNQWPVISGNKNTAEASGDADEDAEPERPSSPSAKKAEEKGIVVVHEAKCKVYVKHDDVAKGWKDIGVGQLNIRCNEGAERASKESTPTIVIRNDVGKILLNALIYKGIKMNVQKNTVASIFHTSDAESSESGNATVVARTYLFRLKNEEEATKLSAAIKENAPSE